MYGKECLAHKLWPFDARKYKLSVSVNTPYWTLKYLSSNVLFQSYPERFYFEGLLESAGALASAPTVQYLPIYFGNVCLRFLPVSALDSLPLFLATQV